MVKIGFSKTDLETALRPHNPVREERIEAIMFYAESETTRSLWAVFDFMDFNKFVTDSLEKVISAKTNLAGEHIHIVTTHNHGGGEPDLETLSKLAAAGAEAAQKSAQPAVMRYVFTAVDKQVNILRRLWIPEIDGSATLFYGASEKNRFNSAPFVDNVMQKLDKCELCYSMGEETSRPYAPFPPADGEVVAMQFRNKNGDPIGSVVRFAAHAVCCNRVGSFSSDYPFHVRRRMEEAFGGISLFFNGPCGDIAPAMNDKFDGTEHVLGEYLANTALSALEGLPFEEINKFEDAKSEALLPVRDEVLESKVEIQGEMPEVLSKRKKYLERINISKLMGFLREKYTAGETSPTDSIEVSLGFLRLNDIIFAAFPGETFSVTGKALQDAFPDKNICTVTEHERTAMYLPPKEDFCRGGYEAVCKITSPDGEAVLRKRAIGAMKDFLDK